MDLNQTLTQLHIHMEYYIHMRYLLLALLLTACNVDPSALQEEATSYACDLTREYIAQPSGLQFVKCQGVTSMPEFLATLDSLGITYETDFSMPHEDYGMAFANHTQRPVSAHVHLSHDSVNCLIDGEGPYHCTNQRDVVIVPNASVSIEVLADIP